MTKRYVYWFEELTKADTAIAGGKGANLGEMTSAGLPVPPGFAVTATAYHDFLESAGLPEFIAELINKLDVEDHRRLEAVANQIQERIRSAEIPASIRKAVTTAYRNLAKRRGNGELSVAVRSSATLEDTEAASFAGMNRSFLNVTSESCVLDQVREVWASLYSPRVIYYRARLQLTDIPEIAVIVQEMVDSETSGVAFSIDPASGNPSILVIEGAFGLGETVVSGQVEPDHYEVDKATREITRVRLGYKRFMLTRGEDGNNLRVDLLPAQADARVLTDEQIKAVADLVIRDEEHYGTPQDSEWAFSKGELFIVQSRPITTVKKRPCVEVSRSTAEMPAQVLVRGLAASPGTVSGTVQIAHTPADGELIEPGEILVADMTTPDWVPFMKRAAAIVTDSGGMTSHAAIVSRELGIPCIVGARTATTVLANGQLVTVDGQAGVVLDGVVSAKDEPAAKSTAATTVSTRIVTATKLLVNLGEPERAKEVAALPVDGVGLLRAEFMLLSALDGLHPRVLIASDRAGEFVEKMTTQLLIFADAFDPRPITYRSTDFRTNEFRGLKGGEEFEPAEENPMIGLRGAYRYVNDPALFKLELEVLKRVREHRKNVNLMIPFVRTERELKSCVRLVEGSGLLDDRDFELWIMAEVPSVVHWLPAYAGMGIKGVSIGSNDLTQLVLGIDRDSDKLAPIFDERDFAVTETIRQIITSCRQLGLKSSICGQAPSVYPDYAETLVKFGIDSISVNPDAIDRTRYNIAAAERRLMLRNAVMAIS